MGNRSRFRKKNARVERETERQRDRERQWERSQTANFGFSTCTIFKYWKDLLLPKEHLVGRFTYSQLQICWISLLHLGIWIMLKELILMFSKWCPCHKSIHGFMSNLKMESTQSKEASDTGQVFGPTSSLSKLWWGQSSQREDELEVAACKKLLVIDGLCL